MNLFYKLHNTGLQILEMHKYYYDEISACCFHQCNLSFQNQVSDVSGALCKLSFHWLIWNWDYVVINKRRKRCPHTGFPPCCNLCPLKLFQLFLTLHNWQNHQVLVQIAPIEKKIPNFPECFYNYIRKIKSGVLLIEKWNCKCQ